MLRRHPLYFGTVLFGLVALAGAAAYLTWKDWREQLALDEARQAVARGRFQKVAGLLGPLPRSVRARDEVDYLLGISARASGRVGEAIEAWGRVPPRSRFSAKAVVYRARLALAQGRLSAAEDLPEAFGDPQLAVEARQTLAFVLKTEGRSEEARAVLLEGWRVLPNLVVTLQEAWRLRFNPPSVEDCRRGLDKAAETAPDDDRVWLGQANVAIWVSDLNQAERWIRKCLDRRPHDPAVWRTALFLAQTAGDIPAFHRAIEHLTPSDIDPSELPAIRAWLANRTGLREHERQALEERVRLCPWDAKPFERLVELAGNASRAEEYRARKTATGKLYGRYNQLITDASVATHAKELAELAEKLGLSIEAQGWWTVSGQANRSDPTSSAAVAHRAAFDPARSARPAIRLADLFADLRRKSADERLPTVAVPDFRDDAVAAGLIFTRDPGEKIPNISYGSRGDRPRPMSQMMGGGVAVIDFDGDGWLDVYTLQGGPYLPAWTKAQPPPTSNGDRLFRNKGNGKFEDVTERAGLAAMPRGYGVGVAVGDVDNDGHSDLFVTRWNTYVLYRNKGDGTFEDATKRFGLDGPRIWPTSAAFADLDRDGDLDLYVCHYLDCNLDDQGVPREGPSELATAGYTPLQFRACPDRLFRNDGGKRFVDVTEKAGIVDTNGRGLGVVVCDLDDDGLDDIFVANDLSANYLFHNRGGLNFDEIAHLAGVAANGSGSYQAGMGVACGDIDGDGRPELAVSNYYGEGTSLFNNLGGLLFVDHSAPSELMRFSRYLLGFGLALFDANNDGLLDIASANGHVLDFRPSAPLEMRTQLLLGVGRGKLVEPTDSENSPWRVSRIARGLAVCDLDNDGSLDLLIGSEDCPLAYFHNTSRPGHWFTLILEGVASNRDAVGARIKLRAGGIEQTHWRLGGGSYIAAADPRIHVGLGAADSIERLEVKWPSGRIDHFDSLRTDIIYKLREGDPRPQPGQR
jgi:tetratricopeptide (TPR) repeat protein